MMQLLDLVVKFIASPDSVVSDDAPITSCEQGTLESIFEKRYGQQVIPS